MKVDIEEAKQLQKEGWTWTKLAQKYGVGNSTVQYHIDPEYRSRQKATQKQRVQDNRKQTLEQKRRHNKKQQVKAKHQDITYFIKSSQYVKIGHTTNLENRLSILQTGNPHQLELLGVTDENECALHVKFAHYHFNLEWFVFSDEIKKWVDDNCRDAP